MAGFSGIEEMEESWHDLAPEAVSDNMENVLDTGREAYLRTKQLLDEAATVSNLLFIDEEDMSQRYRKVYEREEVRHAAIAPRDRLVPDAGNGIPALFGANALFPEEAGGSGSVGGFSTLFRGGALATVADKAALLGATQRRPEEQRFCEAFVGLKGKVKSLPPGHRVQPFDIAPILHDMYDIAWEAENTARDSADRLRELYGDGSVAVAEAAATARELSLEKDTWGLLLMMNGADQEEKSIKEGMRRGDPDLPQSVPGPNTSDEEVLRAMRIRDVEFRRTEHVVKWLQDAVKARLDDLAPAARVRRGGDLGWSATLESLSLGVSTHKSEVKEMHPDANLRKVSVGSRVAGSNANALVVMPLVGRDDIDEEELVRTLWMLVRSGLLGDAKRLCEDRGQPWRAAALSGGAVVGCDGMDHFEENEDGIEGGDHTAYNPGQGLWQDMCWRLSSFDLEWEAFASLVLDRCHSVSLQRGVDSSQGLARSVAQHDAAMFAYLSGNAKLLLDSKLTQSWEDQAWVHFSTLLQLKVLDERIRHRRVQAALSSLYPGVSSLSTDEELRERMQQANPPMTHAKVFDVLDDASRGRERAEGRGWYRQAQQALIMGGDDISLFLVMKLRHLANASNDLGLERDEEDEEKSNTSMEGSASPQLMRFAAHLALILEAQCPYLTMADDTVEAIHDVVRAYTEHLAKTRQVSLVATYAATLPVRQRRNLYAGFLRSLEGDEIRREALELAEEHMAGDVPAILKQVVEDVRLKTPSVAPRVQGQVADGDVEKINALSWLLDYPKTRAEAVVQANNLARHLVLQKYEGSNDGGAGLTLIFSGDSMWDKTPIVLTGRVEAVGLLLKELVAAQESAADEEEFEADADVSRERECWTLLLEARAAYLEWVSAIREQEQELSGADVSEDAAVRDAAAKATVAMEQILTFQDGWMYPQDPSDNVDLLNPSAPPGASLELANVSNAVGTANGDEGMDVSYALGIVEVEDSEDPDLLESRLAKEVAEKRKKRARAIEEEIARAEEASRQFTEATRKEEMLRVREACLPGLVFMTHEVAHQTGLWMLSKGLINVAREWFLRGQRLANIIVKEEYLTLRALSPEHMGCLLKRVEGSTTKLLECDEPRV